MDENNNEEYDASQAMLRARRQAQAQSKDKRDKVAKKGGAILHVNNYRSGIPEMKCKMSKNPNFPTNLKPGYIIRSKGTNDNAYIVEAKLAARVYMVKNQKTEKFCSLKIEPFYNEGDVKQLKRDVFILMEAVKQDARFNHHFPKLLSKGRVAECFNYTVTTLCDFNLDDLREKVLKCDFSLPTAARLAMQSFQAIHDLHTLGYLHRNISPSKFMLGLENPTLIYLGGFSTAYHYKRKDGKESPSPKKLYKMAKLRFLPRAYHRFKDIGRFDDLESWLFTAIDFFGRKLLPWFDNMDESQIVANKERFFFDAFEEIYTYAPRQLQVIQRYIDKNTDDDKPNYTFMGITLVGMRDKLKFPYTGPFDFQQAIKSGAVKHSKKQPTHEEAADGPAIAPTSAAIKKKKSRNLVLPSANPAAANPPPGGEEVFEDGEAEAPQEDGSKPALNADRALSMARKKKPVKNAVAKAAQPEHDEAAQGPLKAVNPEHIKNLKKKKASLHPAPVENENEEEDGSDPDAKGPPPPQPKAKKTKSSKNAKKAPPAPADKSGVEKQQQPPPAKGGEAEGEGGGEEEEDKDDGNNNAAGGNDDAAAASSNYLKPDL